jgi:uncharacterized membrane protein
MWGFEMHFGFSYVGLIYLLMLYIPNIIWMKFKPKNYEKYSGNENKIYLTMERIGQVCVTGLAVIFTDFNINSISFWSLFLLVSFSCLVLYECFWIRYFRSEKTMKDFYSSILGVPLAGATLPVFAFILLGVYGKNILMIVASIFLGIGHIGIHYDHKKEVDNDCNNDDSAINKV